MLRIDEILKEKNISNLEFAEMLDVSPTSASAFKSGRTKPKFDTLVKMAEVLDVDIRELFHPTKGGELLNGFVQYKDKVYTINNKKDLEGLLAAINQS
ncbi:helix-turn-helix domain-containing protein [Flagellimonas okinawensis]|uniref:Helix-turn-helix transcriptional regulator n=1 Tax=Flagellimonas okinawensis TaxID=3031324 RepID=A0ABT5XLU4_9FLAO|nr:helix-turn-helix transcriptional regulator [[Muricauda] okinawensis]MDF0706601.1 helix-turn-helix transcriptional regulator [[Muricauda] okinawensis]